VTPDPPLFVLWYDFTQWLLAKTGRFPKRVRFSFSNRIDNLALDIIEAIVEARYSAEKRAILRRIDLNLEKLRVLLRMCCDLHYPDVHKFFDSVDHGVLKDQLRRKVKDPDLLRLLDVFIDHPVPWTETGKGIPIGNFTSQHFANFHLSGLDHFIKEDLRIEGYVRYMDDLVLWADEKDTLRDAAARIEGYLKDRLRLRVKEGGLLLAPVLQGLPFLGFRIFPGVVRIDRRGWRRFRRKVMAVDRKLISGAVGHDTWQRSMASLVGHLQQADTRNLRASFFGPGAQEAPTG
jgi:phage gp36-like protein